MIRPDQIVFGTMRMHEVDRSAEDWAGFLAEIYGRGVRTLHSSDEYDSFGLLREVLELLRSRQPDCQFRHVVKLAEPSFDDGGFDNGRLSAKLERYKAALGSAIIHDVQWMWRKDLKQEAQRLENFNAAAGAIGDTVMRLKEARAVERFFCFPYSTGFAEAVLDLRFFDGLFVYRNANELDFDYLLDSCQKAGKTCLIIRPFAAGQALGLVEACPRAQLAAALDHAAIESAILSTSSLMHLDELLG